MVMSTLIIKTVSFSETSVNTYQTTPCAMPENSHLHIRRHENVKPLWNCYEAFITRMLDE
jgi:hypothetical protein